MNNWFQQLAPRERLLVSTAAVLVVIAIVLMAAIRPIIAGKKLAGQRIGDKLQLLQDLERAGAQFGPVSGIASPAQAGSNQSLVVLVDRTTRKHGLGAFLKRNRPDGDNSIRLRFENAPFNSMVNWLTELQTKFALTTISVSIDSAGEPGRVNCNLVLAR